MYMKNNSEVPFILDEFHKLDSGLFDMIIDINDKIKMLIYGVNDVKDIPMSYECISQSIDTVKK